MKCKIARIVDHPAFLLLLGIIAFLSWQLKNPLILILGFIPLSIFSIFSSDSRLFVGMFILPILATNKAIGFKELPMELLLTYAFVFIEFIIFLFSNKFRLKFDRFFYTYLVLTLSFVASLIYDKVVYGYFEIVAILFVATEVLVGLIYALVKSTLKGKELTNYFYSLMAIIGTVIAAEVLSFYIMNPTRVGEKGSLNLGWGDANAVVIPLLPCFIFTFYLFSYGKYFYLGFLSLPMAGAIFLSLSRGTILGFCLSIVLLIVFSFIKYSKKTKIILYSSSLALLAGFLIYGFLVDGSILNKCLDVLISRGFDDTGRFDIWNRLYNGIFIKEQLIHPGIKNSLIFGPSANTLVALELSDWGNTGNIAMAHNILMTTFTMGGIVGLVLFAAHYLNVYGAIIFSKNIVDNKTKVIIFIFLISTDLNGMVDNTFLNPFFMVFYFLIFAFLFREKENNINVDKALLYNEF